MSLRASMVIDYQNVHLTARDVFEPNAERHDCLIHPMQFARRAITERNARQRPGRAHVRLATVTVYRGLPHVDYDWEQNRRCLDQATQWAQDGVDVHLRDLKYRYRYAASGLPVFDINGKKIPVGRPEEKGIDVLCALACLREAQRPDIDLVILASRDTDLVPVLDELHDFRGADPARFAGIETVSWFNPRWREGGNADLRVDRADRAPAYLEHQPRSKLFRGIAGSQRISVARPPSRGTSSCARTTSFDESSPAHRHPRT